MPVQTNGIGMVFESCLFVILLMLYGSRLSDDTCLSQVLIPGRNKAVCRRLNVWILSVRAIGVIVPSVP